MNDDLKMVAAGGDGESLNRQINDHVKALVFALTALAIGRARYNKDLALLEVGDMVNSLRDHLHANVQKAILSATVMTREEYERYKAEGRIDHDLTAKETPK